MPAVPEPSVNRQDFASLDEVAGAVDAFRAGRGVRIADTGGEALAWATETISDRVLAGLGPSPLLLLTHARAATLKIRLYTHPVVAIIPEAPFTAERLRAIADPSVDLAAPLKGPFEARREALPETFAAAVKLAKLAGLLPSAVVSQSAVPPGTAFTLTLDAVRGYEDTVIRSLRLVTRARVPLEGAERAQIAAFRAATGEPEHYAVIIGDPQPDAPVLTRLHSECFTGDLLGSLKCDCGDQLRGAIAAIAKAGGGVLLYLAQEGRGIGLINKLRAYRLQDQGFDTVEANERLGFAPDERLYGVAARMLELLGFRKIRLLTNNPEKVKALEAAGVTVAERVPHAFPANPHNRAYLATKAAKSGHQL